MRWNATGDSRTRLFGGEEHIQALDEKAASGARLVTVVGPPGIGKTRVSREWARARTEENSGSSLVLCDLGGVRDGRVALATLARALSDHDATTVESANLIEVIARRAQETGLILVLDNIDHVLATGRRFVEDLLARAPELQIVATSRESTKLAGESVVRIEPLDLDDAIELFIERSAGRIPSRRTPRKTRSLVAEIVESLDRIPLAIELAASRLSVLSPEQLAERLSQETLRTTGRGEASGRHASLSLAIQWSWDLLTDLERDTLSQLSVFPGAFTVADSEAVLALESGSILDAVSSLADRSLVHTEELGRLRLLTPIREFAASRRVDDERALEADKRFATLLVTRAEKLASAYATGVGREALLELETLTADLIAAHHGMRKHDLALAIRAALALTQPMRSAGGGAPYRDVFVSTKELAVTLGESRLLARTHFACGLLELSSGDLVVAADDFEESARIALAIGDLQCEADALVGSGALALTDDEELAESLWRRALLKYLETNDPLGVGNTSANLAVLALERGDLKLGAEQANAALDAFEEAGLTHRLSFPLLVRAAACGAQGALEPADRDARRALEIAREIHHRGHRVEALGQLALIEWARSNFAEALRLQGEAHAAANEDVAAASSAVLAVMHALRGEGANASAFLRVAEVSMGKFRGRNGLALYRTCRALVMGEGELHPQSSFLASTICRLAEQHRKHTESGEKLTIGSQARWYQIGSRPRVSLGRRMILRRLVSALAVHRIEHPGSALTAIDLQEELWPGQDIMPDTAANRLYVSLSKLRRMGLRRYLLTDGEGYLFAPELDVSIDDES